MYERYAGLIFDMDGTILIPSLRIVRRGMRYWGIMDYGLMNMPWSLSMVPQRGVLRSR